MDKIGEFFRKKLYEKAGTMANYRYHIQKFFTIIGKDVETYFDDAPPYDSQNSNQLKKYNLYYEPDIRKYWEHLQHKAPKTKQSSIAAVKQFLKYGDKHTINLDIWETIQDRLKGKVKAISEEHIPEIPEIKRILEYCDIKTKTAILMATSSGMRIGEVMELVPKDVHFNEEPTRINVRAEITKNGQKRTTFISIEATELLKEWLRVRDDYIRDAYKSLNFKNAQHCKEDKKNDARIFPFEASVIQHAFNKASDMAGFTDTTPMNGDDKVSKHLQRKRQRKALHYHNLRKFFRSNFGNVDLAEHLMGHSGYLTEYREYSDSRLAQEYQKYQHNLLVFESSPDLSGINDEIKTLKDENETLHKQMQTMMRDMQHLLIENDKINKKK